jgi:hypothetical protein
LTLSIIGITWIWAGADPSQAGKIKSYFSKIVWALIMTLGAYIIVNTLVTVLARGNISFSLDGFFNYQIK